MLCQKCNKNKATIFYNENINGKIKNYALCQECANKMKQTGELEDVSFMEPEFHDPFSMLSDQFFGSFFSSPKYIHSQATTCPGCGFTYARIMKDGMVGCPTCYETFRSELSDLIQSIHGTKNHMGTLPNKIKKTKEKDTKLQNLRKDLKEAIASENYEEAAKIRDKIKELEKDNKEEN